jgi:adenine-specific DNA glycosylase
VLVAERDGRVWAVQRPAGRHNSGLWEFPQVEEITRHDTRQPVNQDRRDLMLALAEPLGTYQHAITRHRITAYAYLRRNLPAALPLTGPGRWLTPTAVRRAPFSALHRRIANAALDRLHTG